MTDKIIFVVRLSAIGDVLLSLHAVRSLIVAGFTPIFVTHSSLRAIAECVLGLQHIIDFDEQGNTNCTNETLSLIKNITNVSFVPVVDLQVTSRSHKAIKILKKITTIKLRIFRVKKRSFFRLLLIFRSFFVSKFIGQIKVTQKNFDTEKQSILKLQIDILEKAISQTYKKTLKLSLHKNEDDKKWFFLSNNKSYNKLDKHPFKSKQYVVFFPSGSLPLKNFLSHKIVEVIEQIIAKTSLNVVVAGSKNEFYLLPLVDKLSSDRVFNAIGQLNLIDCFSLIADAAYVISGDSFPGHAAAVLGTPASVVFGATSPLFGFQPTASHVFTHYTALACSPCTRHGAGVCRFGNMKCMDDVLVEDIIKNII